MLLVLLCLCYSQEWSPIKKAPRSLLEHYSNQLATLVTGDQHSDCFLYPTPTLLVVVSFTQAQNTYGFCMYVCIVLFVASECIYFQCLVTKSAYTFLILVTCSSAWQQISSALTNHNLQNQTMQIRKRIWPILILKIPRSIALESHQNQIESNDRP